MKKIIHQWKNIQLIEKDIALPTGANIKHTTILHPGATVLLPVRDDGKVLIIKQFRPSLNKWLFELPAGTIEPGESVLACAQRELEEETGYKADTLISLGTVTPMAGFCDEIQHLFVAKDIQESHELQCDDDEIIEVYFYDLSEIEEKIINGDISDAKTIACISKAKLCGFIC